MYFRFRFLICGTTCSFGKLRVCVQGFSEGHEQSELAQAKSEASKRATDFVLAKTSNSLGYTVVLSLVINNQIKASSAFRL